jgi:cytochrome b561
MKTILASRYHPVLVALHWLLAVLIVGLLCVGFIWLAAMPNSDPQKIGILMWHMSAGMLVLALMAIRFVVRMSTKRPADVTTGYSALDRIAPVSDYGFYVLVLLMAGSGYATAILAGLNRSVFQGSGDPLPPSFAAYPSFMAHFYVALLLVGFIVVHVLAALYHQFARSNRLFRRMWFGRRVSGPSAR